MAVATDSLLSTPVSDPIPADDLHLHLSTSPWRYVEGMFNLREVSFAPMVAANVVYRSGMITYISDRGKRTLVDSLGIKAIFDLRSTEERGEDPEPAIDGVRSVVANFSDSRRWARLVPMYMSFLESYREVFQQMLRWVLENLGQPFLVHCTAGKDRTAVAVALLLSIAGVPKESIAHEYAVTRIGIEPVRELLEGKLMGTGGQRMDWTDQRLVAIAQCQYADDAL